MSEANDEELDLYSLHREQAQPAEQPLHEQVQWKAPTRVRCVDDSSKPKRVFYPTTEELRLLRSSRLWHVRSEGFEEGVYTVHLGMRRHGG